MGFSDFIEFFQPISLLGLIFWVGYTYRRILNHSERLNSHAHKMSILFDDQDKIKDLMIESHDKAKEYAKGLVTKCASNKVLSQDITVLEVRFQNIDDNQSRIEESLKDLARKFDDFTKHYYERNNRNSSAG